MVGSTQVNENNGASSSNCDNGVDIVRSVKREKLSSRNSRAESNDALMKILLDDAEFFDLIISPLILGFLEIDVYILRRLLLLSRLALKCLFIADERDDLSKVDSDKFKSIIEEVERLHQHANVLVMSSQVLFTSEELQKFAVMQFLEVVVADAEALLDITNTLVTSVKAPGNEGVTLSDFGNCLIRDFGQEGGSISRTGEDSDSIRWKYIGFVVSHLEETVDEEKTDTDKNMATMFHILRKHKSTRLENLVLNRKCFVQTVENLFAPSFLIKDGRADITVNEKDHHLVSPRNGPAANAVLSGEVSYSHFVFRFDFQDWKVAHYFLLKHLTEADIPTNSQPASTHEITERAVPTTPIRKLTRNRGLVFQEQTVVEESPESDLPRSYCRPERKEKAHIGLLAAYQL
ncbi:hypothetical protein RND71_036942 [Anisodus tanguticus]|uniref:Non-structural maintenance of chromosomes element 4 n=1 Tax=Anisodus tanguticus TaxID=243964 RepID=A0AAE1R2T1_9SOLA|nr:hypothetical protein RND71_036942 [Anisodus tanguticus]